MIKAILFDADGVLIINEKKFSEVLDEKCGISLDITSDFFKGKFAECLIGKADLREELQGLLHKWGWNGSVDDFMGLWFKTQHNINKALMDGVKKLRKNGMKCYLATNNEKYRTEYIINKMGFGRVFDGVFSSCNFGYSKHEPEFLKKVIDAVDLKPEEILLWDDDLVNVNAAKKLGLRAEHYISISDFKDRMKRYFV
jgi:putative hydrolase of the HAD superfamily